MNQSDIYHYEITLEYADRIAEAGYVLIAEGGEHGTVIVSVAQTSQPGSTQPPLP